jgi:hypothetical protein
MDVERARDRGGRERGWARPSFGSLTPLVLSLLPAAACLLLAATGASGARAAAPGAGTPFCQKAVVFGKGANLLTLPPEVIEADAAQFRSLEASMVPLASRSVRGVLQAIFAFDLGLFDELGKVGWAIARVPHSVLAQWGVSGPKLKPTSDRVIGYIDTYCGLDIAKP